MVMTLPLKLSEPCSAPRRQGLVKNTLATIIATILALHASGSATAESYPTRPIVIISPFSPGSPPDAMGRLIGQKLTQQLGQNVIIENRPGGGTTIATKAGAAADPDGYTLLYVNATLAYSTALYPNAGYDPVKSFAPVAGLASWSHLLVVPAEVPAGTVEQLIAYARANPGRVNIGFPLGTPAQVLAETFKTASGAPFTSVPYRQAAQLTSDLVAGRLHARFGAGAELISLVQEGKLKALAYTGASRHPALPQVPTVIESGLPQLALDPGDWIGIVAPAGTPAEAIKTLNAAINETLGSPEVRMTFAKLDWDVRIGSPEEFATFLAKEARKWPALVEAAGLKPD